MTKNKTIEEIKELDCYAVLLDLYAFACNEKDSEGVIYFESFIEHCYETYDIKFKENPPSV